jgi:hypothetical protein
MIIADTDVLVDYLAGKGEAALVEDLLGRGAIRTTVISRYKHLASGKTQSRWRDSFNCSRHSLPLDWMTRRPTRPLRFA